MSISQGGLFRRRQRLGKYRIEKRLAVTGFAAVYEATDPILGVRVALKVPHAGHPGEDLSAEFKKEVRLAARLAHPHILPIRDANFIDGRFAIITPLGQGTLGDRISHRLRLETVLDFTEQMLEAVAYAHALRVIHCDLKPENFILFPDNYLRLADFGIARVALRTVRASGSGTLGYLAPEQAMGRPTYRSDVFSLGLIIYRMLTGQLPEWPFDWPPPGFARLRQRVPPEFVAMLRKAIALKPTQRFADAGAMLAEFQRLRVRTQAWATGKRRKRQPERTGPSWHEIRWRQFRRRFGRVLETRFECRQCQGPVAETMQACPWCGCADRFLVGETAMPSQCSRCDRGMKLDWRYCPWCYGAGYDDATEREYSDKRYTARCTNRRCKRKLLMPWMRYCPWCQTKVRRRWKIPGGDGRCDSCSQGVLHEFWSWCPWCATRLEN
ncbi:MAG: protein kinase [Gammaproteobacteria bacterium]|nr:protein kinase [Gammaproteobacteria bacterium]